MRRSACDRMHHTVVKEDRPEIRGMIAKVRHLVNVEEIGGDAKKGRPPEDRMKLHHLRPAEGAKTERKRVGRGRAGARGKTAGRGHEGNRRAEERPGLLRGWPDAAREADPKMKGFSNPNRVAYAP